jgi:penicillin amidase
VFDFTSDLPGSEIGRVRWQSSYLPQLLQQIDRDDISILQLNETTRQKTWRDILLETLKEADNTLRDRLGPDFSQWEWGKLHRQTFVHNLGRTPPYSELFNIQPVEIGGDASTVFNAGAHYGRDFAILGGVSFRMIIDFADLDKAVWVLPPGQSGHPGSPHYADGIKPWLNLEYHPMMWNWKRIKASQEATLWLLREHNETAG